MYCIWSYVIKRTITECVSTTFPTLPSARIYDEHINRPHCPICRSVTRNNCLLLPVDFLCRRCGMQLIIPIWSGRIFSTQWCNLTLREGEIRRSSLDLGLSLWVLYLSSHTQSVLGEHSPENMKIYLNTCNIEITFTPIIYKDANGKEHWKYSPESE